MKNNHKTYVIRDDNKSWEHTFGWPRAHGWYPDDHALYGRVSLQGATLGDSDTLVLRYEFRLTEPDNRSDRNTSSPGTC